MCLEDSSYHSCSPSWVLLSQQALPHPPKMCPLPKTFPVMIISWHLILNYLFFVVQLLSVVRLFATPWTACSTPGFPVLHHPLEFAQTHVH